MFYEVGGEQDGATPTPMLRSTMLCFAVLCYAMLCFALLGFALLCYSAAEHVRQVYIL
jgi:hypothetical protein